MGLRFATTTNGRISMETDGDDIETIHAFGRLLSALDGTERYSLSLWKMPDGRSSVVDVDYSKEIGEFLQSAGSASRMTVEVRVENLGVGRLYTVGRLNDSAAPDHPQEVVVWDNHELLVRPNEVFDAESALEVFKAYFRSGVVPPTFSLRAVEG